VVRTTFPREMNPSRRHFHVQNAAKCRVQASRSMAESERRAWIKIAEEWEQLASEAGRWSGATEGREYFDQGEAGISRSGLSPHEPQTK
jgi:hypothetical protein